MLRTFYLSSLLENNYRKIKVRLKICLSRKCSKPATAIWKKKWSNLVVKS